MAARLIDKQKKKIIADYIQLGSYAAVGRQNHCSDKTVKAIVEADPDFTRKSEQKKRENTADILDYLEQQKNGVCEILDICLNELKNPDKIKAAGLREIATTMAILIDKYTAVSGRAANEQGAEDDALTASLKELAKELEAQ